MRLRPVLQVLIPSLVLTATASAADWSPAAAAKYLDGRQEAWFAWKPAQTVDGTCISCHTGMPYLLARPALRRSLGEAAPTEWETKLLDRLERRAGEERKGILQSIQTIFGGMFLKNPRTLEQLHALQLKDGPFKGVWQWYDAKLDPWETPGAFSYGAALGVVASGGSDSTEAAAWLRANRSSQPLHSQLAMLRASSKVPGLFSDSDRKAIIEAVTAKQSPDGSWTIASLGPWLEHPEAPPQPTGGHPYATAFAAFVLREAAPAAKSAILSAQSWLKARQDPESGAWPAVSMNKTYPEGSMESRFMQDAATSFAVLALLDQ